ncbi:archease [Halobellus rubicundus]|uniref:Archease n=1 Tax=Halobellus rubicundus TaxID=2996466 RepID=A0ABD5MI00_9EURY
MPFELRDHTADVAVEAVAPTLSGVFAAIADGLAAASCDEIPAAGGETVEVAVDAQRPEALLFDYLDELIYERDVRAVLPVDHEVRIEEPSGDRDEWRLAGTYRGVPLERVDAREVKAVTYSEMRLDETDAGWSAYVVFDV